MSARAGRVPDGKDPHGVAGRGAGGTATGPRRQLAVAVLCCVAGAGLAAFAATRTWSVETSARGPLPGLRAAHTGGELLPWLPALALAGLAGAGALLATRGPARRAIGVLLLVTGVAVAAGGGYGTVRDFGGGGPLWPLLCGLGGALIAAGGAYTVVRSRSWPAMGARYERMPARSERIPDREGGTGPTTGPAGDGRLRGRETAQAWEALDRGEDPTVTGPGGR